MVRWRRVFMSHRKLLTRLLILGVVLGICIIYFVLQSAPDGKVKGSDDAPLSMYGAPYMERSRKSRSEVRQRLQFEELLGVERVAEYCNIPSQVVEGEEGEAPKDYRLSSVYVIIRHGDRTPMTSHLNIPPPSPAEGCTMDTEVLQTVPELQHFVQDMELQKEQQTGRGEFSNWSLYPQHVACGSSQLTGRGALQHLFNGLSLRRKYMRRWGLFAPPFSPSLHLAVHSTVTSRTYQSALAFLYALLPRFNVSQLQVRAAPNVMFCRPSRVPGVCCLSLDKLRQEVDRAVHTPRTKGSAWQAAMPPLAQVFGVKADKLPGVNQLIDILQGHACHGLLLPCGQRGRCVTSAMLEKLWVLADGTGRRSSQEATFDRYCRTVIQSLLLEMMGNMLEVSRNRSSLRFTLYSGHDLTMTPLLQTLGLYEGKWPHYATRVVWELYTRRSNHRQHYLRILHNGVDITSLVRFCQGRTVEGMCALKHFRNFVTRENMKAIGVKDTEELQAFCRSKAVF